MKPILRVAALAAALGVASFNATADPITYTFELVATSWGPVQPANFEGYIVIDDALEVTHGSGTLRTWDIESDQNLLPGGGLGVFGSLLAFGQQYGNDLNFPLEGLTPAYVLHTPSAGAIVTFADGVPVSLDFGQQHLIDRFLWRTWEIDGDTYMTNSNGGGSSGTFAFTSGPLPAVPEPSTLALLLAGFAWTGRALRRRRSAQA
jgi:hypothetical protein